MGSDDAALSTGIHSAGRSALATRSAFILLVILLAVFQFSENTADPDLWGHVLFGQEIIKSGSIPRVDSYSWTAQGQPWINHEVLAEVCMGTVHSWLGGGGLLLLKMGVGLAAFFLALRLGAAGVVGTARLWAWAFGALAVVEISYGFAARPQIFTALFLVLELLMLRRIHAGRLQWAAGLPILFLVWINTHGGVLAGYGLLVLTVLVSTAQMLAGRNREKRQQGLTLWLALIVSGGALWCNPWGGELVRWLVGSVLWSRPEIEEWNAVPMGWDHAAFFIVLGLTVFACLSSRHQRAWWEVAACAAFAVLALKSTRNTPLFCLVALATGPLHLGNSVARFQDHFARLTMLVHLPGFQKTITALMAVAAVGVAFSVFTLHKENPLTMEVSRSKYPVGAVNFIREHQLNGRLVNFFDWGEMVIFELPDCLPSIDGRLDTCYSRELITAHWKFYNDQTFDRAVFDPDDADLALLPSTLVGAQALAHRGGWQAVYFDDVAVVLARQPGRFPSLLQIKLPVEGRPEDTTGRAAFPNQSPRWAAR